MKGEGRFKQMRSFILHSSPYASRKKECYAVSNQHSLKDPNSFSSNTMHL